MEKPAPPGEAEDLIMQQYPSPAAEGQGIGTYYDAGHSIHQLEQQEDPMDQSKIKDEAPPSPAAQEQVQQEQEQERQPSVSAADDELQLAARLTERLAPMMAAAAAAAAAVAEHSEEAPLDPPETGHDPNYTAQAAAALEQLAPQPDQASAPQPQEAQVPLHTDETPLENRDHSQESQNTSLQSQDPDVSMQDANPPGEGVIQHQGEHASMPIHDGLPGVHPQAQVLQEHNHGLDGHDQNAHAAMPQHDQQQSHLQHPPQHIQAAHYVEPGPPQSHLPPHLQMAHIAQQAYNGVAADNSVPPRKRSKVSRACDECRRKKVKCDAISETGETACSNCRRSQLRCDFSRIPQKRGPSKGYIKELADRINSIEGKLGNQSLGAEYSLDPTAPQRRDSTEAYSPSVQLNENSKRPYSGISGDNVSTPVAQAKLVSRSSEPRPIHPYPSSAERQSRPLYSVHDLAPRQPQSPSRSGPMASAATAIDGLQAAEAVPAAEGIPDGQFREIDDHVFHGYLTIIHPTFPFLAGVKAVVQSSLAQCPPTLQSAFLEALVSTMQSFHAMPEGVTGDARTANRWLAEWEADALAPTASRLSELVHLQTLLLLAIEADNHGPAAVRGKHGGSSKTSFLARGVSVAYAMSLRSVQAELGFAMDPDPDSEDRVALRAWWSLVALDRFNAIGTAQPLLIPQTSLQPTSALRSLLGEGGHHFIKLSYLLGYYVECLNDTPSATSPPVEFERQVAIGLTTGLEMWRMDLPGTITPTTHPVLHFAYWHCRIISYLFQPRSTAHDLMWALRSLLNDLATNELALSPLNHAVVALAAVCLVELAGVATTRDEARRLIDDHLLSGNLAPSTWDSHIRQAIPVSLAGRPQTSSGASAAGGDVAATASQSLQRLADLAAATTELQTATAAAAVAVAAANAGVDAADIKTSGEEPQQPEQRQPEQQHQQPEQQAPPQPQPQPQEFPPAPRNGFDELGFDPRPILRAGYLNAVYRPMT